LYVNGPKYAIDPAAKIIFPTRFLRSSSKSAALTFHLSASLANPDTNFSALTN
jgi:hypothetical protein